MALIIQTGSRDETPVLKCEGRLVYGENTAEFCSAVELALAEAGACIVDLSGITDIDAHGMGVLVRLYTSARAVGGWIELKNVPPRLADRLRKTRISTLFDSFKSGQRDTSAARAVAAWTRAARAVRECRV